jgi:hypothetical protein
MTGTYDKLTLREMLYDRYGMYAWCHCMVMTERELLAFVRELESR